MNQIIFDIFFFFLKRKILNLPNKRENKVKISLISYIQIIKFIWCYFWNAAVVEINGIFSVLLDQRKRTH